VRPPLNPPLPISILLVPWIRVNPIIGTKGGIEGKGRGRGGEGREVKGREGKGDGGRGREGKERGGEGREWKGEFMCF
jgi:hypothetical protein